MVTEFEAHVQQIGERLIVRLPVKASGAMPSRGQVAVDAQVNGQAFRTVLEPDGRKGHWIAIDEQLRNALSLQHEDSVQVQLETTKEWPEPELPSDFETALAQAEDIASTWTDITPMARWEWVRWIGATKNPQTRERRIEVSVSKLRDGSRRPCCFDLSSCTDPELAKSGKLIESDPA